MRKLIVNGHLGADPEVKTTKNGNKYTTFRMANSEYTDENNATYWFNVTVWDTFLQNWCINNLKKGSFVLVDGEYSNRLYTSNKTGAYDIGNDIRAASVHFGGGSKRDGETPSNDNTPATDKPQKTYDFQQKVVETIKTTPQSGELISSDDDELPF